MGLDLKTLRMCVLFLFWGWATLLQGTKLPGPCVRISACTVLEVAKQSMSESNILEQLAEAATKNQGGNKAIKGIKGLKVKDIQPPNITIGYIEKKGMCLSVVSQITIAGKSFIGGTMEITVRSNMTTENKMIIENKKLVFKVDRCTVQLISCKTNLPSSMLPKIVNKFLNSTLQKVMPGMMCPAAEKVGDAMKQRTDEMWAERQCGSLGTVQYSINSNPKITSNHATICFEAEVKKANGEEIESPTGLVPLAHSDMPELGNRNSDFLLPVGFMDLFMKLYEEGLNQDISSDTMDGGPVLSSGAMKEKVPSMEIPDTYDNLMSKIRSASSPTWILIEGAATLNVPLTLEFVSLPQQETLFILDVNLRISATFRVEGQVLQTSLGSSSLEDLIPKYSKVGAFDPEHLNDYLLDLLKVTSVPALQEAMKDGMPLPSMMGSSYAEPAIEILPNAVRAIVHCESE